MVKAIEIYPQVKLFITELMSGDLAEMLREGRLDAAILFNVKETDDFTSNPLIRERLHLIGAPDAPLVQAGDVKAELLRDLPLVGTFPPHGLRLLLERWSNKANIPLHFKFQADAPSVLVRLAAKGECYSIVAKAAIAHEIGSGTLYSAEVESPAIERTASVCTSKRPPPDKAREALVSLMESVALDLVKNRHWPGAEISTPSTQI